MKIKLKVNSAPFIRLLQVLAITFIPYFLGMLTVYFVDKKISYNPIMWIMGFLVAILLVIILTGLYKLIKWILTGEFDHEEI
jgi:uncharacterized membrane protein YjjP (DUF1212 family)